MQDEVHATHRFGTRRGIGDASRDEAHAVGDGGEILPRPAREIVEDDHLVPRRHEVLDEMRADESGSAGDQISHTQAPLRGARRRFRCDSC